MCVIRSIIRLVSYCFRRNHRYFPQSIGRSIGRSMIPPQPSGRSSRQSVDQSAGRSVGRSLIPPLPGVPGVRRLRLSYGGRECASVFAFGRKSVCLTWFLWRGCFCSCFLTPSLPVSLAFDSGFCFWSCNLTTSLTLVLFFDGECTPFLSFEVGLALVLLFDSNTITLLSFRMVPTVERRFAGFLLTWRVYFA